MFNSLIVKYCSFIPQALVASLIQYESSGRVTAEAHGNYGLMQVRLGTAKMLRCANTVAELKTAEINIKCGCMYLKEKYDKYEGNIPAMLAAYNAGTVYISKKTGKFVNQKYVDDILRNFRMIKP